jgi:drug/metabolite transporter (DMT)-like permease
VAVLSERPSTVAWIGVLIVIASLLAESRSASKIAQT